MHGRFIGAEADFEQKTPRVQLKNVGPCVNKNKQIKQNYGVGHFRKFGLKVENLVAHFRSSPRIAFVEHSVKKRTVLRGSRRTVFAEFLLG